MFLPLEGIPRSSIIDEGGQPGNFLGRPSSFCLFSLYEGARTINWFGTEIIELASPPKIWRRFMFESRILLSPPPTA